MASVPPPRPGSADDLWRALVRPARPPAAGALPAVRAFAWRGLTKIRHNPDQLADAVIFPIMFMLLFTSVFGGAIAGSPRGFLQFFLPGILVMASLMTSMYVGFTLNVELARGGLARFRALPVWRPSPLVGAILASAVRGLTGTVVCLLAGVALGFRPHGGLVGVLLALALLQVFAFSLAWIWTLLGVALPTPATAQSLMFALNSVLLTASDFLAPERTMPAWLRKLVGLNPVTHAMRAVRGLMAGTATADQIGSALVACAVLVVAFAPPAIHLYHRER
jgi:ABC-2 type transport system permease protein